MNNPRPAKSPKHSPVTIEHYPNVIYLYCDGACKGNPGPGGCGIVLVYNGHRKNFGVYLGEEVTNNIAELQAVRFGLSAIKDPSKPIVICSDSTYVIGLLSKGWTAKSNQELVAELKETIGNYPKLSFLQVPGHSFVPLNEDADKIASFVSKRKANPMQLVEMEVPKQEKLGQKKAAAKRAQEGQAAKPYKDPYYNDKGPKELEDPQSEEIRKLVEEEMEFDDWEEASKKPKVNEWGIEEN